MASLALEEKINKIRLKNEEIKRRYEEVEADKKNAAKLDALTEPIPLEEWPMRKEPPEFSGSVTKHVGKTKHSVKKHNDQPAQYYTGSGEGKKSHTFADGQGPPPDPKYNFLADSEREERSNEIPKELERNKGRNKTSRGGFKRRGSGRDWQAKEHWNQHENPGNMTHPEYEAWRAERNRIDEARINRQRTAEGNWRREWDNDKIHLADDVTKRENRVTLDDLVTRHEHNENEKYYRSPRTTTRISHQSNGRESHQTSAFSEPIKTHGFAVDNDKRLVVATEKSIKVLVSAQNATPSRSSVMSVKVSSPNIAGTGRVGPRQRPRVTYSSQSETDSPIKDNPSMMRQRSTDESTKVRSFDQSHKTITSPKSPHYQRKSGGKMSYPTKKDNVEETTKSLRKNGETVEGTTKSSKKESQKSPNTQKSTNHPPKSPRFSRQSAESIKDDITKLSQAQQKNITKNDSSEEVTRDVINSITTVNSSIPNDKSNDLPSQVEGKAYKNEDVHFEAQEIAESVENSKENAQEISENLKKNENIQEISEITKNSKENITQKISEFAKNSKEKDNSQEIPEFKKNSKENDNAEGIPEISKKFKENDNVQEISKIVENSKETDNAQKISSITENFEENDDAREISKKESIKNSQERDNAIFVETQLEKSSSVTAENNLVSLNTDLFDSSTNNENQNKLNLDINNEETNRESESEMNPNENPKKMTTEIVNDNTKHNNSVDDIEFSDNQTINCSANSELTSNDSGFIELPSNNSIHDISDRGNVELNNYNENCMESQPSTSRAGENDQTSLIHVKESKGTNDEKSDVESSTDLQITLDKSRVSEDIKNNYRDNDTGSKEDNNIELQKEESVIMEKSGETTEITEESKNLFNNEVQNVLTKQKDDEETNNI